MVNKSDFVADLKSRVMRISFTKKDGTERVMLCTLQESHLPKVDEASTSSRKVNDNVVAVYDIENQGWRSIIIDSIFDYRIVE
jgi:hypothetical protein